MNYGLHRIIIFAGIVILSAFGFYGNISLIVLHIRKPMFRTKYGILLALLTFSQSICIVFEWIGAIYTLAAEHAIRSECFRLISTYVFTHCIQMGLFATIAIDLLNSIIIPLRHRMSGNYSYVLLFLLPSLLYGSLSVFFGYWTTDDEEISMCNPPNALQETLKDVWYKIAFVLCGITVFCYALAFVALSYKRENFFDHHRKDQKHEAARKSMRSLTVIFSTFLCTRFITILIANALNIAHVDPNYVELCQMYSAITAMMSYSLNFYVIFWRGRDYRQHLRQQQEKLLKYLFGTRFKLAAKSVFTSSQSASTSVNNTTVIGLWQR